MVRGEVTSPGRDWTSGQQWAGSTLSGPAKGSVSSAWPLDFNTNGSYGSMVPAVTWATEINMDPSCNRTTNPDMALSRSSGPDITMVLVAMQASQISFPPTPSKSMALGHQHGLRWLTRLQASPLSSMKTGTTDINTDCGCGRTTDSDTVLCNHPGLYVTMAPGGSIDHPNQLGLGGSISNKDLGGRPDQAICSFFRGN